MFVMVKFRKCKSVNYISATETIITSTTGTGQKGCSFILFRAILSVHAAAPGPMPCMICFVHNKPMKLNGLKL